MRDYALPPSAQNHNLYEWLLSVKRSSGGAPCWQGTLQITLDL